MCSDNTATIAAINKQGGTRSWELTNSGLGILVPSGSSRLRSSGEACSGSPERPGGPVIQESPESYTMEWSILGDNFDADLGNDGGFPFVDLFATRKNRKLKSDSSLQMPDEAAWKVNALTFTWEANLFYTFPSLADSRRSSVESGRRPSGLDLDRADLESQAVVSSPFRPVDRLPDFTNPGNESADSSLTPEPSIPT